MTPARRTARACRITAVIPFASAIYSATHHPLYAVPGLISTAVLLAIAAAYDTEDRRIRARHEQLRRAAVADEQLLPPVPCCSFWRHSGGEIHGPDCTRPPDARTPSRNQGTAA
ncbi:hypothetical protein [Streptomyces purpurascens]|uniref:hypothetical protein n=1 Tax=Streptomyces purpurascens TaxID=1924 RepID=UPI001679F1DD|nr:hypothetical protein [Streptomyces purpurascens]MCE7049529.1 hypothetical protein [Streptomyces purpurascens]GHA22350.1 hypothetical protein GCM10010303_36080 [Streptomyces purpurascens]